MTTKHVKPFSQWALIAMAATLVACSPSDDAESTDTVENILPTVNAGLDDVVRGGATFVLSGAADDDGSIASQSWTQTAGTEVVLSDATSLESSFTAPNVSETLTFTLTAIDDEGESTSDSIDILIKNDIALYLDPNFVDYEFGDDGSEAANLEQGIPDYGYAVNSFTGTSEADFTGELTIHTQAVLIPELEEGNLNAVLDDATRTALSEYVANGGVIVTFGDTDTYHQQLWNQTFGWTLSDHTDGDDINETYTLQVDNAEGTSFENGSESIEYADGSYLIEIASLPAEAKVIYSDSTSVYAAVIVFPVGSGYVVFLAYDWYDAAPFGEQDGGWIDVLDRAIAITD